MSDRLRHSRRSRSGRGPSVVPAPKSAGRRESFMLLSRKTPRRLVVAAAAGSALVLATATGAGASGSPFAQASYTSASAFKGHAPTIDVNVTTDGGFSLPRQVRAGFVTFRVSTPDDTYHGWQGFRLENGATVDQVIHDFTIGVAGETLEEN